MKPTMAYASEPSTSVMNVLRLAGRSCLVAAASCCLAVASFAQDGGTVTLKSEDGETTTGALIEVNDQVVVVKTSIGLVAVPVNGTTCIGQACPETIRLVSTAPVLTFVTPDGALAGQGQLLEISSDHYVIATDLGEVRLHVDEAFCAGTGCPTSVAESQFGGDVVLSNGAMTIEGQLVGVEGASYIVEVTNVGAVRVDTALFECSGAGCP